MMYIGRTGRILQPHVKEHKRALRLMDTNLSAVAHHAIEKNHEIDWENAIVNRPPARSIQMVLFRIMAN